MNDTWQILQKELAYHGFRLISGDRCQVQVNGNKKILPLKTIVKIIQKEIDHNEQLFEDVWVDVRDVLYGIGNDSFSIKDEYTEKILIHNLQDMVKFIHFFSKDTAKTKNILETINAALSRDISVFSEEQISKCIDLKISIDWLHRLISKLSYIQRLLIFASKGRKEVSQYTIKTARGISGPWANLDLPMRERTWKWWEESENQRGRGRDIRSQRRYTKGRENYNNDGRVGEGHYWREPRNEPYSWYDQDSPYPSRNPIFNH